MCFIHWCNLLSFDSMIAPWLSELSSIVSLGTSWISERKVCIHSPSFVACANAMYSDSVLDNAIIYCFFELHVTMPWPIWNEYLDIECQWGCPTQSTLQYPHAIDLAVCLPLKVSHNTHTRFPDIPWLFLQPPSVLAHGSGWIALGSIQQRHNLASKSWPATGHFQSPQHMAHHTFSLAALGSMGIVCSKILCQDPWVLKQVLQRLVWIF